MRRKDPSDHTFVSLVTRHHSGGHRGSEYGIIESRLGTPGAGLDHNGRRVLTYAGLRSPYCGVDERKLLQNNFKKAEHCVRN